LFILDVYYYEQKPIIEKAVDDNTLRSSKLLFALIHKVFSCSSIVM